MAYSESEAFKTESVSGMVACWHPRVLILVPLSAKLSMSILFRVQLAPDGVCRDQSESISMQGDNRSTNIICKLTRDFCSFQTPQDNLWRFETRKEAETLNPNFNSLNPDP